MYTIFTFLRKIDEEKVIITIFYTTIIVTTEFIQQ